MGNCLRRKKVTTRNVVTLSQKVKNIDPSTIDTVPYRNQIIDAYICDVYDGDTFTFLYMYGNELAKSKIRLARIDCPEMRGKCVSDLEKQAARAVKQVVSNKILDKQVNIKILSHDKYGGRLVAEVYLDGTNTLSDFLLENKLAKPFDGRCRKEVWTDYELRHLIELSSRL